MKTNITAVLAANRGLELTRNWYKDFRNRFPKVPVALSCISPESQDLADYVKSIAGPYTKVFVGKPKDGHDVSFSENYNAAINLVETDKLVLIHNDMQFCDNFFEILDQELNKLGQGNFITYTTFEPPIYTQHRRAGKIIRDWQNWEIFNSQVKQIQQGPSLVEQGSGFFRAGWSQDFGAVGGFDQNTFKVFCEDDDLVLRTELKGFKTFVSNWACCYHFVSKTSNTLQRQQLERESCIKFVQKWGIQPYQCYPVGQSTKILANRPVSSFGRDPVEANLEINYLDIQKQIEYIE